MAPMTDQPVLTLADLETETALALPERELLCASSCGLLAVNAQVCVSVDVDLGCANVCAGASAGACIH